MDYEKAYKEAFERAKNYHDNNFSFGTTQLTETIFPELKKSEDERIREYLIRIMRQKDQNVPMVQKAIAYLEKQKDLTKEDIIKQLEEEFYACGTTPKWFHDTVQGAINHGRAEALGEIKAHEPVSTIEQKEQKPEEKSEKPIIPEWSEDDEKMRTSIIFTLAGFMGNEDKIDWLKSLRSQPKQKRHLGMKDQWCCSAAWATVRDSDAYNAEEKQFILDFLQRCESQPHWKPSEEQMKCLRDFVNRAREMYNVSTNGYDAYPALSSLYNDLKNL